MSQNMVTLHEIAVKHAKKQSGMVDSLTEEAPILQMVKWKAATHGLWNVAEKITDIEGPAFVRPDAPLPQLSVSSDLVTTDLSVMGGTMEVPTQRAKKFGGPMKYFSEKQNYILKKAGMDTERQLVFENWLKGARAAKNLYDAGGAGEGWFLLAVRFDELANVGLYDPDQFDSGRLLKIGRNIISIPPSMRACWAIPSPTAGISAIRFWTQPALWPPSSTLTRRTSRPRP